MKSCTLEDFSDIVKGMWILEEVQRYFYEFEETFRHSWGGSLGVWRVTRSFWQILLGGLRSVTMKVLWGFLSGHRDNSKGCRSLKGSWGVSEALKKGPGILEEISDILEEVQFLCVEIQVSATLHVLSFFCVNVIMSGFLSSLTFIPFQQATVIHPPNIKMMQTISKGVRINIMRANIGLIHPLNNDSLYFHHVCFYSNILWATALNRPGCSTVYKLRVGCGKMSKVLWYGPLTTVSLKLQCLCLSWTLCKLLLDWDTESS